MSEYWKSTPKYWCKHCQIYVRDSKLERANHEATGKHQGAIKRSLRDLHRNHENAERDKDRAKREVERLNGVVSGSKSANSFKPPASASASSGSQTLTKEEQQRQLEQLAGLGVNIPTQLRPELALPGEWTVTSTRVLKAPEQGDDSKDSANPSGRATGVRKREREKTEEEQEEEEALKTLFKKPRRWGRETKSMPTEGDDELDQLLSGTLVKPKKEEDEEVKVKPDPDPEIKAEEKQAQGPDAPDAVKQENVKDAPPLIKHESTGGVDGLSADIPPAPEAQTEASEAQPAVVFKKRKPKNVRQH
ncbi:hypothetical protein CONLIGDRAFT_685247 [Coniochaeta ligniaria NRRL 30616]|uniref:U1-C C2H2-type zinc finger domain-containing protein n=1 Tax=Coniochaeta ligniaria NRRL 30616 TaxID=1408157 RepID=A0A1J7JCU2_9PEZI|nr:hypothetical protein CONLIGDRAFT_685247 [Coniochaeta ligniaria NRRL 30616]